MSGLSEVNNWLSDFKELQGNSAEAVSKFAQRSRASQSLFTALENCLETCTDFKIVAPICEQIYQFYKHEDNDLRKFSLELLPIIILTYLRAVHHRKCILHASFLSELRGVAKEAADANESAIEAGDEWLQWFDVLETLVLCLYNIAVLRSTQSPTFVMPSLAQSSIYHQGVPIPGHIQARIPQQQCRPVKCVNNENRFAVLTQLVRAYADSLDSVSSRSQQSFLDALCRVCDHARRLVPHPQHQRGRIVLDEQFLLQSLQAVYFILFTSQGAELSSGRRTLVRGVSQLERLALETLLLVRSRASYDLFPSVMLVANAVLNSLHTNPSGQPSDGPIGIAVIPQPALDPSVTKNVVTNASFRTRRLPEDIPIAYSPRIDEEVASDGEDGPGGTPKHQQQQHSRSRTKSKSDRRASSSGIEHDFKEATQSIKKNLSNITKSLQISGKHSSSKQQQQQQQQQQQRNGSTEPSVGFAGSSEQQHASTDL